MVNKLGLVARHDGVPRPNGSTDHLKNGIHNNTSDDAQLVTWCSLGETRALHCRPAWPASVRAECRQ